MSHTDAAAPAVTGAATEHTPAAGGDTTAEGGAQVLDLAALRARLGGQTRPRRRGRGGEVCDDHPPPARPDAERPAIMASPRLLDELRRDALAALLAAEEAVWPVRDRLRAGYEAALAVNQRLGAHALGYDDAVAQYWKDVTSSLIGE